MEGRGENKKGRREKKREVEAEEKEGLQHKLIDMQSGCSSIRVHTLAKASHEVSKQASYSTTETAYAQWLSKS